MINYNPDSIALLQRLEKTTRTQISKEAHTSISSLSKVLNKQSPLKAPLVETISKNLDYPLSFFNRNTQPISVLDLTYRHTSKSSATELNAISAEYTLLLDIFNGLANKLRFVPGTSWIEDLAPHKSSLSSREISHIADLTRLALGLTPRGPINNVTRAIERSGIAIAPLHTLNPYIQKTDLNSDGVTFPQVDNNSYAIGYRDTDNTGDRDRFTKAHELGHIVLHKYRTPQQYRDMEREAHIFAGAFLMPNKDIETNITQSTMLSELVPLKAQWGISIAALISRGYDANIYGQDRKRSLYMQLSARGWRKQEPVTVEKEHPLLLKQMIEKLYGNPKKQIDTFRIENELAIPFRYLNAWADGLTEQGSEFGYTSPKFADTQNQI